MAIANSGNHLNLADNEVTCTVTTSMEKIGFGKKSSIKYEKKFEIVF